MIKKPREIELILEGGKILGEILHRISNLVEPSVSTLEIDREAERMIIKAGGRPSFKGYRIHKSERPFATTICASINNEVVHAPAIPSRILNEGDIFSIDIGMEYPYSPGKKGYYTDTALTLAVGSISKDAERIMKITRDSLFKGIETMRPGRTVADIGRAVEREAKKYGAGIVKELVGHGVGYEVHEPPQVPNYYVKALEGINLERGMVIAVEPMLTLGTGAVEFLEDGWTVVSADRTLSAHFEHTIVIGEDSPIIATLRPGEKYPEFHEQKR